jgi:hypothetical protein
MIRYVEYSIEIPVQMSHRNEGKFFMMGQINYINNDVFIISHIISVIDASKRNIK